jgi:hypothetical protein
MSLKDRTHFIAIQARQFEKHRRPLAAFRRLGLWLQVERNQILRPHDSDDHSLVIDLGCRSDGLAGERIRRRYELGRQPFDEDVLMLGFIAP